jgi:hypothetical protein
MARFQDEHATTHVILPVWLLTSHSCRREAAALLVQPGAASSVPGPVGSVMAIYPENIMRIKALSSLQYLFANY